MSSGGAALQPTFNGYVGTTQDALILFEACLQGHLSHVPRRPHDRERVSLIRSGCIFIYEENASGIKRWTDGVTWSPSRILGNFLVYRELDKPFPPGEKKRAMKKQQRRGSRTSEPAGRTEPDPYPPSMSQSSSYGDRLGSDFERSMYGSLTDSYGFKKEGLIKKTMSVTVQGVTHHLVSYYTVEDVSNNNLRAPSQTDTLQYIHPRPDLTSKQSFRTPLEEAEENDGIRAAQAPYGYRPGGQNGYMYMPQYPPMAQPGMGAGFSQGPPLPPGHYYAPGAQSQMAPQRNDYGPYDHNAYNRGYDPLSTTLPPTTRSMPPIATSPMPPIVTDRHPSQQGMYPPPNTQRPPPNLSPIPMDNRGYRGPQYTPTTAPSPLDASRPGQASPIAPSFDDRRDSHQPAPVYSAPRGYYDNHAPAQVAQPQYSPGHPPMGQWPGSNPPQS